MEDFQPLVLLKLPLLAAAHWMIISLYPLFTCSNTYLRIYCMILVLKGIFKLIVSVELQLSIRCLELKKCPEDLHKLHSSSNIQSFFVFVFVFAVRARLSVLQMINLQCSKFRAVNGRQVYETPQG